MRRLVSMVCALVLVTVALSAKIAKTSEDFSFATDVRIGGQTLKAGNYHFVCDEKSLTISRITVRTGGDSYQTKVAEIPVKQVTLPAKSAHSELNMPKGSDGVPEIQSFLIEGSPIQFVIQQ